MRRAALLFCLGLGLTVARASDAGAAPLRVSTPVPVALIVVSPTGSGGGSTPAALRDAAERILGARTRLVVPSLEQLGVDPLALDACRTSSIRLTCWAKALRNAPARGADAPRYALVVSRFGVDETKVQVSLLFVDLAAAVQRADAAPAGDPEAAAEVEDAIFASATRVPPVRVDAGAVDPFFERAIRVLQPRLHTEGLWGAVGSVEVQGVLPETEIRLDGRPVGRAEGSAVRLEGVPVGRRTVAADLPWLEGGWSREVQVTARQTAVLTVPGPPPAPSTVRIGTRWGGLLVAAAGVALVGVGATRGGDLRATCLRRAGDEGGCDGLGTPTFGLDPTAAPSADLGTVDRGGVAIAPLGAGLIVAGGVASGWAWSVGPDEEAPWWGLLVGLVAGGATYGLGHALGR